MESMTFKDWIALIGTQGLALVLVISGFTWFMRIGVPRYFEGLNRRLDENTESIDILSAIIMTTMESKLPPGEIDEKMAWINAMKARQERKRANGHKREER